ncbi:unnamed protein product [Lepeophtheirus salmonis]|uniref:(salmon louse) hypothetical protein n=1 Tax=Lepeophtheirus salmonis TaxID=72036 RepID=A0A7R8CT90_LEPSM|nr:unnamed protein product [Lepeophtheirus salmonis]CAF2924403.1 unnamed protein product [Lepeophtheirus salmonis]
MTTYKVDSSNIECAGTAAVMIFETSLTMKKTNVVMVGMPAHVDIPHYRWAFNEKKRKYVEYRIDFWLGDGSIYVQKYARYSQLHIFHSKIRSLYRRDLSEYLRNIVQREDLGHSLLNFFRIRNTQRSQGSDKLIYPIMGFLEDEKKSPQKYVRSVTDVI